MSFTNTSPLQVPTRGKKPVLGTNPLTLAAPARDGDSFVLDMATSGVAVGKVAPLTPPFRCKSFSWFMGMATAEVAEGRVVPLTIPFRCKSFSWFMDMATSGVAVGKVEICDVQKTQMPRGWGVDNDGQETTDPKAVLGGGALLPLGGLEITSGYKGYGLAMLVEIFCGILANADYGPNIRFWKDNDREANLGQCFLAIDPEAFAPGFQDRMQDMIDICRASEPVDPSKQVLVPGDPERNHMAMCDTLGGIPYHPNLIEVMARLAKETSVEPMKTVT
ncbi:Delta(1)-pyrroline-2-carboxylate/Delta(1)-piperideine-2-carboxylate reductase [Lamellibrachia satsuma]|nr:Delta(1)-pyrroline-2-carboxylate/Delta(1)-piperideine-2-carboxylate reductase [Lamellibrachia satsuma]